MADLTPDTTLAMEAGPELDALVAERVMGWTRNDKGFWFKPGKRHNWNHDGLDPPPYSTDIAAAWEVVEKIKSLPAGIDILVRANCVAIDLHMFDMADGLVKDIEAGDATTAPLAICRAALLTTLGDTNDPAVAADASHA